MTSAESSSPRILWVLAIGVILVLVAVIVHQQSRISDLSAGKSELSSPQIRHGKFPADVSPENPTASRSGKRPENPLDQSRKKHLGDVERQLEEISAPLAEDMASSTFKADIKEGDSIVTGGYKAPDGRNQFSILKPMKIRDDNGNEMIRIDSKLAAMSSEDTTQAGLDSLATNAKNTLQHAESWDQSDVSKTLENIKASSGSELLSSPSVVVKPGQDFEIEISSGDGHSYSISGTAESSPNGSGVVLKARVVQK